MFPRRYLGTVIRWDPSSCQLEQCELRKDDHGRWKLQTVSSLSLLGTFPHVLALDILYNVASGQYEPFALRTGSSKTTGGDLVLSRWSTSTRRCHDVYVAVDSSIARSAIGFGISSGPSVICFTPSTLYITFPLSRTAETLMLSSTQLLLMSQPVTTSSRNREEEGTAIDHVWSFDWTGRGVMESGSLAAVLLVVKGRNSSTSSLPAASFLASLLISLGERHHPSPQEVILPQEYASIITCLTLQWRLSIGPDSAAATTTPQFILGTSYNQLVVVMDGNILHCIDVGATPITVIAVQVRHVG